jgi:hypothetical protein
MIPTALLIPEGLADVARDALHAFSLDVRLLVALPDVLYGKSPGEIRASVTGQRERLIAATFSDDADPTG